MLEKTPLATFQFPPYLPHGSVGKLMSLQSEMLVEQKVSNAQKSTGTAYLLWFFLAVSAHTASTWENRHGGYPTDHHTDRLFHPVPPDHYRHLVDRRCLPDSRHHPGPYGTDPPRRPAGSCSAAGSRRFRVAPSRLTGAPRYGPRRAGEETDAGRWDKEKSPSAFLPLAIGADSLNPELAARAASTSH